MKSFGRLELEWEQLRRIGALLETPSNMSNKVSIIDFKPSLSSKESIKYAKNFIFSISIVRPSVKEPLQPKSSRPQAIVNF